eukprot:432180_1
MEIDILLDSFGDCIAETFIVFLATIPGTIALFIGKVVGVGLDVYAVYQAYEDKNIPLFIGVALMVFIDRGFALFMLCKYGIKPPERYEKYAATLVEAGKFDDKKGVYQLYNGSMFSSLDWMARLHTANTFVITTKDGDTIGSDVEKQKLCESPCKACKREGACLQIWYMYAAMTMSMVFIQSTLSIVFGQNVKGNYALFVSLVLTNWGIIQHQCIIIYGSVRKMLFDRKDDSGCCNE